MTHSVKRRLQAVETALVRPLPTFEQFREEWEHLDGLSKSFYETALSYPELIGATGRRWDIIRSYLQQMGVPSPLEGMSNEIYF